MRKTFELLCVGLLLCPVSLFAQVRTAGRGGSHLTAGGFFSNYSPDYGQNRLDGVGGFADFSIGQHVGGEVEARFLRWNQKFNVHEDTYLVGLRYAWRFNRLQPYAKVMVGNGQFNFPFNYAHGGYLVLAPGVGVDYRLNRRFFARGDFEYQHWSSFQKSSLGPSGFSAGIGYRIF